MKGYGTKLLLLTAAVLMPLSGSAALMSYTDKAAFMSAVSALGGVTNTLDFDGPGTPAGTIIADNDIVEGVRFDYLFPFQSDQLLVSDIYDTTSPNNFLGVNNGDDLIYNGDDFTLSFAGGVNALGFSIITAEEPYDGTNDLTATLYDADIELEVDNNIVASLDVDATPDILADGSLVFFLGIVDPHNQFSKVNVKTYNPDPGNILFTYNVDDIITSVVPIPGAAWLFLSGLIGLFATRKKASR